MLWTVGASSLFAQVNQQQFQQALKLYQQEDYLQAAQLFQKVQRPEGQLFAGKSYYAGGQYLKAQTYLESTLNSDASPELREEAVYTLGLVAFQMKNFGESLQRMYRVYSNNPNRQVGFEARRFYNEVLNYLTLSQRREAFEHTPADSIRFDLVKSAFRHVDYPTAQLLVDTYQQSVADSTSLALSELRSAVSDSVEYASRQTAGPYPSAPEGITYNIGAALPAFDPDQSAYTVSQSLYNGFVMAAEEFNRRNTDKKAFIHYEDTRSGNQDVSHVVSRFIWQNQIDFILGPLFSESAEQMARLAEQYQIPLIAPLANSDSLNIDNPYVYQANPTFTVRGKTMADYAVRQMGLDSIAVIAGEHSLGYESAFAFREEAERLGAKVPYFFIQDFESTGYDMTEFGKYVSGDKALLDSLNITPVQAVYAPFTGEAAPTLIDLLLTDLEASGSSVKLLGSQEWGAFNLTEPRARRFDIHYTQAYRINVQNEKVQRFKEEYRSRFGLDANRFAMLGYDAADYVLRTLERVQNPALLKNALKNQPVYQGLAGPIDFSGTHINQRVPIYSTQKESADD